MTQVATTAAASTKVGNNGDSKAPELKVVKPETKAPARELTVDEKIQRVNDLNDLIAKRTRFLESRSKLNSFNLKREDATTKITLTDQEGNSFVTSHTDAIGQVLEILKRSIEKGLTETVSKIQF
jgi:hypothetical protein